MQISPVEFPSLAAIDRLSHTQHVEFPHAGMTVASSALDITLHESMAPLEKEWRALEADPINSLHQSYDWCLAWAKTHRNPLAIIRGKRGGKTAFILPLEIVRASMVRSAQFIAARYNNINSGLFSADFRAESNAAEATQISQAITGLLTGKADLVNLQNIPLEWRGEKSPFAALPAIENQNHAFQLPLTEDFQKTIGQLNAKRRRKKFRGQVRKIEATGGFEHFVARSPREKSTLLNLFFEQKAIRFKALGLPNTFQAPETQAFFHLLLEVDGSSLDTPLELHAVRLKGQYEGRIAAIAGLSRKGDHVICQFGSIDESLLPEASPGELLFWLMIERSCEEGAALFDFGLGDQEYKRRWCTVETVQHDILLPISAAGHVASFAQRGVVRTKAVIKGNPQLYSFIQRLRAHADDMPAQATGTDD
ncbi:GNAT family N-acetyltransferase [Rhizobium daejeonense]|nr:GNAT family N-acetyltransferase [Rhizobium daejeonense]